jgi:hypothetical protein
MDERLLEDISFRERSNLSSQSVANALHTVIDILIVFQNIRLSRAISLILK